MGVATATVVLVFATLIGVIIALVIAIRRATKLGHAGERAEAKRVELSIVRDADEDVKDASEWSSDDAWRKARENFPDE